MGEDFYWSGRAYEQVEASDAAAKLWTPFGRSKCYTSRALSTDRDCWTLVGLEC